ncbi:hypothetical protein SLA2020_082230 [Shorea laevis]
MEEYKEENDRKRARGELDVGSPVSKLARLDSAESDSVEPDSEELDVPSPEVKLFQDDLLNILDDSDPVNESDPGIQGLDSVIKSFEEEISVPAQVPVVALDSGESKSDLGFLLEASDDELGLPPSFPAADEPKAEAFDLEASEGGAVALGEMLGFEEEILSYDSFELGIVGDSDGNGNNGGDFVALGGLFDHNESYEPAEVSEFAWRTKTLPAL